MVLGCPSLRTHTLRHHMDMQTVKRPNCRQLTCLRGGTSGISWSRIDPALIGLRAAIPQSPDKSQSFNFPQCLLLFIIICEYITFEVMFDEVNLYGVFQTKPLLLADRHNQSEVVLINKLMRNTKKTKQLLISIM